LEETIKEEKKAVGGILLDTTAYSGSSFEMSEDAEQEEEATVANITISSSDEVGVLDVSEGKFVHVQEKFTSQIQYCYVHFETLCVVVFVRMHMCVHFPVQLRAVTPLKLNRLE
jgi:hypothetical protein